MPRINHEHDFQLVEIVYWTGSEGTADRRFAERHYRCLVCNQTKSVAKEVSE